MKKNRTKAMAMATITALTMCVTSTTSAYAGYFPEGTINAIDFNDLFDKYPIMVTAYEAYKADPANVKFSYNAKDGILNKLNGRPVVNGQYADGTSTYETAYKTDEDNRYVYDTFTMVDETTVTEEYIKAKIEQFKVQYPKYTTWTNDNYYSTTYIGSSAENSLFKNPFGGWGCAGFGGLMAEYIFQDLAPQGVDSKVYMYSYSNELKDKNGINFNTYEYKIGDVVRLGNYDNAMTTGPTYYNGYHTIVITDVNKATGTVTYSDGNSGGMIWHDSTMPITELQGKTWYVMSAFDRNATTTTVTPEVNTPVTTPEQYVTVGGVQVSMSDLLAALQSLQ